MKTITITAIILVIFLQNYSKHIFKITKTFEKINFYILRKFTNLLSIYTNYLLQRVRIKMKHFIRPLSFTSPVVHKTGAGTNYKEYDAYASHPA